MIRLVVVGAVIAGQAIELPSLGVLARSAGFMLAAVFFVIGYGSRHCDGGTSIIRRLQANAARMDFPSAAEARR